MLLMRHACSASLLAMVITLAAGARPVRAQQAIDAKSAGLMRDKYLADLDTVHSKVMALAQAIPDDKYGWRPAPGVRSVSEVLMHVAGEWYYWTPRSVGQNAPADFGKADQTLARLEKMTKKSEVLAELEKSWTHCKAQVAAVNAASLTGSYDPWKVTLPEAAFSMAGDLHEHLGQLIAYARTNGVTPPWSK